MLTIVERIVPKVGHADVLGGHLVVIDQHAFPFRARLVGGVVKLDAHLAGAPGATPAGHDLVGPGPHEIAGKRGRDR